MFVARGKARGMFPSSLPQACEMTFILDKCQSLGDRIPDIMCAEILEDAGQLMSCPKWGQGQLL